MLAAGLGTRMRPLTDTTPKALLPVGGRPLVDWAIDRVRAVTTDIAVNVHHHRDQMVRHLAGSGVHVSIEEPDVLGTAGAVGKLRPWIAGRPVLVVNADGWHPADLVVFAEGWTGEHCRLRCVRDPRHGDFGELRFAAASLLPAPTAAALEAEFGSLYDRAWMLDDGVELVERPGPFFDCGTRAEYAAAIVTAWARAAL